MSSDKAALVGTSDPYALWAATYEARPHNALMEVEQQAVLAMLPVVAGLVVLDAGCGTGRYAALLGGRGASRVFGCDASPGMLARAAGPGLMRADIRALPLAASSIDVVVCGLVLPDIDEVRPAIRELARVLRAGGSLVASLLHPRGAVEGWRRTFETPEGTRELRACWHTLADLQDACAASGLTITATREPGLNGTGDPVALVVRADRA